MPQVFDAPLTTTDQSLDRVLAAGLPVLVVFVDGGQALDETLRQIARERAGHLLVVKLAAAENPSSARRFGISRVPAVVAVRGGTIASRAQGIAAADLTAHVAYVLGQGPRPEPMPAAAGPARAQAPANGQTRPAGSRPATGQPIEVTDATWDAQVLRSAEPVLVDFWAPWCGPCHMVAPAVEHLAQELAGRLRVAKVNVDQNPGLTQEYQVQSIPTMMIFKNGQAVDRWLGAQPEGAIRARVKRVLG
jgi:thioredoxin 1